MSELNLEELSKDYELSPAVPEKIPAPTYWPITMAFGTVFFFWGFITSLIISAVGLVIMGFSLSGWIGDMNNE
jgi:hypothetical protein